MSPEAVSRPETVDARSDIYSLGAVGYWLLTGKTMFDDQEVEALMEQQVKGTPRPPAERLGKEVSADLAALIMQCLAKPPEQRPANGRRAMVAHKCGCRRTLARGDHGGKDAGHPPAGLKQRRPAR